MLEKKRIKNIIIGSFAFLMFFVLTILRSHFLQTVAAQNISSLWVNALSIVSSIALILFFVLLFYSKLKVDWKDLKKNHRHYFKTYLPYWLIALGLTMIANLILNLTVTDGDIAENEQIIREIFKTAPIMVYFSAVIVAPIVEELVFRGSFFYIFKNKYLFIFLSGISFGLIHVLGAEDIGQFLFIIPYSLPGFAFAYALYQSRNLYVPIALHFIHNGLIMALQTMIVVFGGIDLL